MTLDLNMVMQAVAIWAVPILMAITFHEAAHGYVAKHYGDGTAFMLGRVTLNPFKHIDLFGTILMPALLVFTGLPALGYAKPVPVNFRKLKPFKWGVIAVAAAGPLMNLFLAIVSVFIIALCVHLPSNMAEFSIKMAWASVQINLILMIFNMLPLPPLDGSRILSVLLPARYSYYYDRLEPYGMWIVLLLAVTGGLFYILRPMLEFSLSIAKQLIQVLT